MSRKTCFAFTAAAVSAALLGLSPYCHAGTYVWPGTSSGTQNWSNASNWTGGVVPPAGSDTILQFNQPLSNFNAYTAVNDLASPYSLYGLVLSNSSPSIPTLSGGPLEFTASPSATISPAISMITNSYSVFVRNEIQVPNQLILSNGGNSGSSLMFYGPITGPGALLAINAGYIGLQGTNTYTGGTQVQGSSLAVTNGGTLGPGPVVIGGSYPGGPQLTIGGITNYFFWPHVLFDSAANITSGDGSVFLKPGAYVQFAALGQDEINRLSGDSAGILAVSTTTSVASNLDLTTHPDLRIGTYAPGNNVTINFSANILPANNTYRFGGQDPGSDSFATADALNVTSNLSDGPSLQGRGVNIGSSLTGKGGKVQLSNRANSYSRGTVVEGNYQTGNGMTALEFSYAPAAGETPLGSGPLTVYGTLLFDGQGGSWGALTNPLTFMPGSELVFNSVVTSGNGSFSTATNAWPDSKPIALDGTTLTRKAWNTSPVEKVGPITFDKRAMVLQDLDTHYNALVATGIEAQSITRLNHGTLELGATNPPSEFGNSVYMKVDSAAGLMDPATGVVNPYIIIRQGDVPSHTNARFAQIDASGKFQVFSNYVSGFDATTDSEVPYFAGGLANDETVWALNTYGTVTIAPDKTLTIRSGGLIVGQGNINGGTISFSNGGRAVEGLIYTGEFTPTAVVGAISSTLSTSAGITKFGPQTLTLSGNNTFTGGLFINDGTVTIANNGALNSAAPNPVFIDTFGTLDLGVYSPTVSSLTGTGRVTNNSAAAVTLTIDNAADDEFGGGIAKVSLTKKGAGTLTLSGRSTTSANMTILDGTLRVAATGALGQAHIANYANLELYAPTLGLEAIDGSGRTVIGDGSVRTVVTTAHIQQASLEVAYNATLSINPDGGRGGTSTLNTLSIAPGGTLDLGDNDLVLSYTGPSPEAQIQQYVKDGLSTGTGLIASQATRPGISRSGRALAVFDNHDAHLTTLGSVTLDPSFNQVLVKYTYLGDANADGRVDPTDYAIVDGQQGKGHSWVTGDLNFDGKVDPTDYAQIDGNQGAGYGGDGGPQLTVVPEPAQGLLLLSVMALIGRRRRVVNFPDPTK
jgi:fibronectin-binding autotransporter adhesin